ncbi:heterokaryon incompatibility protein-domain-containing protein [Leptodontidium sp. MPI-SDFR-AT-0119]|nr:heterokaryon incompatibility protein-domain-containing protein [Leptodontidium sp. MPI-SDFR-AT-0119]
MYNPLSAERKEIRVLSTHPPTESPDPISCSLTTVSLLEDPVYDALSYVWGDPKVTSTITVDGYPFEATKNLVAALKEIRKSSHLSLIWIDAICINQASTDEKNQQVPLMQDIYRGAQTTLLWLGEAGEESRLAFQLLRRWYTVHAEALELIWTNPVRVEALLQKVGSLGEGDENANSVDPATMLDFGNLVQSMTTDFMGEKLQAAFDFREYNALIILLSQPYWRRVWIVQEFSLSRQLVLLWGSETLDYRTFSSAYGTVGSHSMVYGLDRVLSDDHLRAISNCVSRPLETLIELKTRYSEGDEVKHMSLWELISKSKTHKATLPVDRIFSLSGLLGPSDHQIDIDYCRSAVDVFVGVATRLIQDPAVGLKCLGFVGLGFESKPLPGLPSWVPNFADPACCSGMTAAFTTGQILTSVPTFILLVICWSLM